MLSPATPHTRRPGANVGQSRASRCPHRRRLGEGDESRCPEPSCSPAPPQLLLCRHLGRGGEGDAILSVAGQEGRRCHLECGKAPVAVGSEAAQRQTRHRDDWKRIHCLTKKTLIFKPQGVRGAGMASPSNSPPQTRPAEHKAALQGPGQRYGHSVCHSPRSLGLHHAGGEPQ